MRIIQIQDVVVADLVHVRDDDDDDDDEREYKSSPAAPRHREWVCLGSSPAGALFNGLYIHLSISIIGCSL